MNWIKITLLFLLFFEVSAIAQVNFTALDNVNQFNGKFRYGTNFGVYPGWIDLQTADVVVGNGTLPGIGIDAIRGSLPHHFLEQWNYEIRKDWYAHYQSLGANNHLTFVGYPAEAQRDQEEYCDGEPSELFANMYEPIWDDNNGTAINENNPYATYIFRTVSIYKDHIKFWEIMNEPDFTANWPVAFGAPGQPGNWWENVPQPCDMAIKAPFFHYVRMMRISWEVIKTVDPEAYVLTGGIGNEAFLDALCRYTDNPDGGQVTADFPHTGGAYFDVLSFHYYPHFDNTLRTFNGLDWDFHRHSDLAAQGVIEKKASFQSVLDKYGFDGNQYPEKLWQISEMNVPRLTFNDLFFGSNMGQVNFTIKSLVKAQQDDLEQVYFYNVSDNQTENQIGFEFNAMGQLKFLGDYTYPNYGVNDQAIALKTTFDFLNHKIYNEELSQELNLPIEIDGAVFTENQDTVAVLWAKTNQDQSEAAFAEYTLPSNFSILNNEIFEWNYSDTQLPRLIADSKVQLNGSPVFAKISANKTTSSTTTLNSDFRIEAYPNPTKGDFQFEIFSARAAKATIEVLNSQGKIVDVLANKELLIAGKNVFDAAIKHPRGLYFIVVKTERGLIQTRKLIVG